MKKKKTKTRSKYVKDLDKVFSQYIRLKNANSKGICECYTCGKKLHWKKMQNGHFISRSVYKYRRDENNCKPQCYGCNIGKKGNYIIYTNKMIKELGQDIIEKMVDDKVLDPKPLSWIREQIDFYTAKVKEYGTKGNYK